MRESIGTVSLLNFIIFFILLIFAFLIGTFSYYKAYRVNNAIVSSIEKYEGHNGYAREEIKEKLYGLAYEPNEFVCPKKKYKNVQNGTYVDAKLVAGPNVTGNTLNGGNSSERAYVDGYCVYFYPDTYERTSNTGGQVNKTDQYNSYEVVTLLKFQFPIVQDLLKIKVSARTSRIYDFEASRAGI